MTITSTTIRFANSGEWKIPTVAHRGLRECFRGHFRGRGFTLIELLVVISIIALLMGILLPSLRGAYVAAQRTRASNNLRNIALSCITMAQGNGGYFPGLKSDGTLAGAITPTATTFGATGDGADAATRFALILNANGVTPEMLVSSLDATGKTVGKVNTNLTAGNFSYALMRITDATADAGRRSEWRDQANSQAVLIADRALDIDGSGQLKTTSIHTSTTDTAAAKPENWRGAAAWGDGHLDWLNSALLPTTRYGASYNMNDNLFSTGESTGVTATSSAMMVHDGR